LTNHFRKNDAFYELLRSVCWNFTDASKLFSEEVGKSGMLEYLLKELKLYKKSFKDEQVIFTVFVVSFLRAVPSYDRLLWKCF